MFPSYGPSTVSLPVGDVSEADAAYAIGCTRKDVRRMAAAGRLVIANRIKRQDRRDFVDVETDESDTEPEYEYELTRDSVLRAMGTAWNAISNPG